MVEKGTSGYKIVSGDLEIINAPLPKEHQSTLLRYTLTIDGKPAVFAWFKRPNDYFGVYWINPANSPNEFLSKVQELTARLRGLPGVIPHEQRTSTTLEYMLRGEEVRQIDIEEFSPIEDLDNQGKINFARLSTPFGDFAVEEHGGKLWPAFITHVTRYDELTQFIVDNSADGLPLEGVKELLDTIQNVRIENIFT